MTKIYLLIDMLAAVSGTNAIVMGTISKQVAEKAKERLETPERPIEIKILKAQDLNEDDD